MRHCRPLALHVLGRRQPLTRLLLATPVGAGSAPVRRHAVVSMHQNHASGACRCGKMRRASWATHHNTRCCCSCMRLHAPACSSRRHRSRPHHNLFSRALMPSMLRRWRCAGAALPPQTPPHQAVAALRRLCRALNLAVCSWRLRRVTMQAHQAASTRPSLRLLMRMRRRCC